MGDDTKKDTALDRELKDVASWACCSWPETAVRYKYRIAELERAEQVATAAMLHLVRALSTPEKPSTDWIAEAIEMGETFVSHIMPKLRAAGCSVKVADIETMQIVEHVNEPMQVIVNGVLYTGKG
jgi:hypothetical protein